MTIVSGLKIKASGRCLVWIKSSERLAKINDSSIIMLWLYICGKKKSATTLRIPTPPKRPMCPHTTAQDAPVHVWNLGVISKDTSAETSFLLTRVAHRARDVPKHAENISRQRKHECITVTLRPAFACSEMARWMHDVSSRRLTQEKKGKSPISLKINDPEKKISYRFYKWKLGTSLGQTISEWNTWPIARDKMTDSALLDQTWKHKKGKHKQDKLREMKYIY